METQQLLINMYHFLPHVKVLGPGIRSVLWVQGCPFECDGCIAQGSHDMHSSQEILVSDLAKKIIDQKDIEGITISGGEPFIQAQQIKLLIKTIKEYRPELSVMIFTGFTYQMLLNHRDNREILIQTDILVDGLYAKQ